MQHNFADGKYTVINDNGKLTALRHGEHWNRDLCGDNLVYWMLVDYDKMKEERDELLDTLKEVLPWVVTQEVACNGLKCREAVCQSCNSDSEESAQKAWDAYAKASAVVAKANNT